MTRYEQLEKLEELLIESLGESEFLLSIIKALDSDTKENIYMYIARNWDIDRSEFNLLSE